MRNKLCPSAEIPEETRKAVKASLPKGYEYLWMRKELEKFIQE